MGDAWPSGTGGVCPGTAAIEINPPRICASAKSVGEARSLETAMYIPATESDLAVSSAEHWSSGKTVFVGDARPFWDW